MKVTLISYTSDALELLLYTKNTRLQGEMSLRDIKKQTEDWKMQHLSYMLDTIKSSWEFVDYVFEITGVSRAFTHQLVRTRNASYAQQAQRAVDVSGADYISPPMHKYDDQLLAKYEYAMEEAIGQYSILVEEGMERQDARGVIPTNVATNIIMKANLRTLHQMAEIRLCTKAQGEYQTVFRAMKAEVVKVHPWASEFIKVFCANHGTCCFPRHTECPIQRYTYNAPNHRTSHHITLNMIETEHDKLVGENQSEANPIAVGGRADG